ncbi:MAG: endolytic transglycosylase MltG [Candidatus Hydrogenedentes bacterium]|nr:endolytic transglycosylase MltG [Candidatus Hydrogenedentota bacterium]
MTAELVESEGAEPRVPKRRWFTSFFLYVGVGLVMLAMTAGALGFMVYDHVTRPGKAGDLVRVTVPKGATGQGVGELLAEKRLIEHEAFFRIAMRLEGSGRSIQQGFYLLPDGLSPLEVLRRIYEGPKSAFDPAEVPDELKVVIPEGLSVAQIASLFDNPRAFHEAASDAILIARLGIEATTLEGFLMPDTYFFDTKPTERQVVERMVGQFEKAYGELMAEFPEAGDMNKLQVVTIASLIEEEAQAIEERPLVAAVIYNRLEQGGPLALDSTLQFITGKYGQRMLDGDKLVDSPYNTYRYGGLPPGPISNPGRAALRAALQPADVDYLYFVSNADGKTHTFSRTMAEHNAAVARFRKEISVQRQQLRPEADGGPS